MSSSLAVSGPEPSTGTSYQDWFQGELSNFRTGQSYYSHACSNSNTLDSFRKSDGPLYNLVIADPMFCGMIAVASCMKSDISIFDLVITDPGAQNRSRGQNFVEWSKNLAQLSAAAKAIIPELRQMNVQEQRNLRQYYRKLYRKD
jgi:hypothetical protein